MKKEFYIGQPLIVKDTGRRVIFADDDGDEESPCNVLKYDGYLSHEYYEYEEVEPSTEFKFSEIITGLEQEYFEKGTSFQVDGKSLYVDFALVSGYGLKEDEGDKGVSAHIGANLINATWKLVKPEQPIKEMTLKEIEAELGYKVKLKDDGVN